MQPRGSVESLCVLASAWCLGSPSWTSPAIYADTVMMTLSKQWVTLVADANDFLIKIIHDVDYHLCL